MRAYVHWLLLKPRYVWVAAAGLLVGVAVPLWLGGSEQALRLSGLALQLGGIISVVWGIVSTREFFGLPSVRGVMRSWWKEAPFQHRPPVVGTVSAELSFSAEAHAYTSHPVNHSAPLDERIESLDRNIAMLHERISSVHADIRQKQNELKATVNTQAVQVAELDVRVDGELRRFGTGSLHISAIGAAWLFFGSVLGSASPELAAWVR